MTLTFYRLGKVARTDAIFYLFFQSLGGLAGMLLMVVVLGAALQPPEVNYIVTIPGAAGVLTAFVTEWGMSAGMMLLVLLVSNSRYRRLTGLCSGLLIAVYITWLSPISGMSMNPTRTLASAAPAGIWSGFWLYCLAPPCGMLAAAEIYTRLYGDDRVHCAKLHHVSDRPCIFCEYRQAVASEQYSSAAP